MLMIEVMATAAALAAAFAQPEPPDTWSECVSSYGDKLQDCCELPDEQHAACASAAGVFLSHCLENLPDDASKPDDCWYTLTRVLYPQCQSVCMGPVRQGCYSGLESWYTWCISDDPALEAGVKPEWVVYPETVTPGGEYFLSVKTWHESVELVTFWVVRLDAPADDPERVIDLGQATGVRRVGDAVWWDLTANSSQWNLTDQDRQVMILARSEGAEAPLAVAGSIAKVEHAQP